MFCPNCGSKSGVEQNYCRECGLKLDEVVAAVADQSPSKEYARLQRRKELLEKLGFFSLSIAGLIALALLMFKAIQYKILLLGEDVLIGSAIGALIGFTLLSVFFFNYPKAFLNRKGRPADDDETAELVTAKLLEDRPPDYVSSVTEDTTRSLLIPRKDRRG
jgi:hypothetical protein